LGGKLGDPCISGSSRKGGGGGGERADMDYLLTSLGQRGSPMAQKREGGGLRYSEMIAFKGFRRMLTERGHDRERR